MPKPVITEGQVWEDGDAVLMARIRGNDGNYILQANVASIAAKLFDVNVTPPSDILGAQALTVASVVFDTLQTSDPRWTIDSTGYNFLWTVPAVNISNPVTYQAEIIFTPSSGGSFPVVYKLPAKGLLGS